MVDVLELHQNHNCTIERNVILDLTEKQWKLLRIQLEKNIEFHQEGNKLIKSIETEKLYEIATRILI